MKRLLALALAAAALTAGAASSFDSPGGIEVRAGAIMPSEQYWDDVGLGCDAGLVFWGSERVMGLWLGAGAETLTLQWTDEDSRELDTDLVGFPCGASILLRGELFSWVALRAEIGARYMFLDVEDDPDYYDRRSKHGGDRFHYSGAFAEAASDLEIEDTALAVVSLQLEFNLRPLVFAVGGGYQFDLCNAEISYRGEVFAETDFSGAFAFVNLGIAF